MKKVIWVFSVVFFLALTTGFIDAFNDPPPTGRYKEYLKNGGKADSRIKLILGDEYYARRNEAIFALADDDERQYIPLLIKLLQSDDHMAIRNVSASALGRMKAREAVPALAKLLLEQQAHKPFETTIVNALGEIGDPKAGPALYEALFFESFGGQYYGTDLFKLTKAIIAVKSTYVSNQILRQSDRIKNSGLLDTAIDILGEIPVEGSEKFILEYAKEDDENRLRVASRALIVMKSKNGIPILIKNIEKATSMANESVTALGEINSQDTVDPLIEILELNQEGTRYNPGPSRFAAKALALMKHASIPVKVLEKLENNSSINKLAAFVLGRHEYVPAVPLLRKRLANSAHRGHDEMAIALGMINDRDSIPLLMVVLRRHNSKGSGGAAWALGTMRVTRAVPLLIQLLDEDSIIFVQIIDALGSMKDRRAIRPLIRTFYDLETFQAVALGGSIYNLNIASSLINIGGHQVRQFVRDCIYSSWSPWSENRRTIGRFMLSNMKDKKLIPLAKELLNHSDPKIRKSATVCLRVNTEKEMGRVSNWRSWAEQ